MAPPKLLKPSRPASVHWPWPRYATCACGENILLALSAGQPFRLQVCEILPPGKCDACQGRGWSIGDLRHVTTRNMDGKAAKHKQGRLPCALCGGTGQRGEEPTTDHVLVDTGHGTGRPFAGTRASWEAAHARHRCT